MASTDCPSLERRSLNPLATFEKALEDMKQAGMRQAVVRKGWENSVAIATYCSVDFAICDRLMLYRRQRPA